MRDLLLETRNPKPSHSVRDVVLLHGWGTTAAVWKDLGARLALRFRVHALDLPGYGVGPACAPCTPEAVAGSIADGAPACCGVVGWSLGAQVALAWARAAPRQVARLALIAATPCFTRRADWQHGVEPEVLSAFSRALVIDRAVALRRFIALEARGDERAVQVALKLRAALAAGGEPGRRPLRNGLAMLAETDLRGELSAITQETLVVHGDRDAVVPVAAGEALARRLPAARLEIVRGAGHAPFVSRPRQVAGVLREFLDG
jgi:pimeloyl-[acyl-carrier protein] methyl ester esterase